MAPKNSACPIPTGWTLETEVQKDGSKISFYYCPGTGQQFYTYFELMRYVEYAKRAKLGIYSPNCKSRKRTKNEGKDSIATESRKTSVLSIRRKPSDSNSSTLDQSMDSESSTISESTDREKDHDYVPESESSVMDDSQYSDAEFEVNQVLNAEWDDLEDDDDSASD